MKNKSGSAFLTTMGVIFIISIASAAMIQMSIQQAFSVKRTADFLKAQAYAEAGANEAYSILKTNFSARANAGAFPQKNFADGNYDVTVTSVGNNQALIFSTGNRGLGSSQVMMDIQNFNLNWSNTNAPTGSNQPPPTGAFACAIVSGGNQTWGGSSTINVGGGRIHANGQMKMTGSIKVTAGQYTSSTKIWLTGSTRINVSQNASSPIFNVPAGGIVGTKLTQPVPMVSIPNIDLTPYYNAAAANGQVYNGNQSFSGSSTLTIPGGIMWVNGTFKFSGSGNIVVCIIATGNIDMSGSGNQIKVGNYPALVSRDGNIDISGSQNQHGLIYAPNGSFNKTGSGSINGSIIARTTFDAGGSWSSMNFENSTPQNPNGQWANPDGSWNSGNVGDQVGITAWQK